MSRKRGKYPPEFRAAAVHEVIDKSLPIAVVARENGLAAQTLATWFRRAIDHADDEPELSLSEGAWLRELEREVRELRIESGFLGKATAFFAKKSQ